MELEGGLLGFASVEDNGGFGHCIDLDTLRDARKIHEKVYVSSEPIYASSVFMYVGLRCNNLAYVCLSLSTKKLAV